ncbi:uncharacterized [Tachysurus ichikawai]
MSIRNRFPPEVRPGAVLEVDMAMIDLLKPTLSLRMSSSTAKLHTPKAVVGETKIIFVWRWKQTSHHSGARANCTTSVEVRDQ